MDFPPQQDAVWLHYWLPVTKPKALRAWVRTALSAFGNIHTVLADQSFDMNGRRDPSAAGDLRALQRELGLYSYVSVARGVFDQASGPVGGLSSCARSLPYSEDASAFLSPPNRWPG